MFQKEIGIDIGTANILVYSKSKGIVFNQPTVVAYDKNSKKIISIGQKAKDMIGKNPKNIEVIRPLKGGVIADFDITSEMVQSILKTVAKITGTSLRKPTVIAAVPYGSTTVDNRAIIDAIRHAGAKSVHLIEEPIAAAIGAGLSVNEPVANTIINMGAGTTEAAIISLGGIVTCQSIKVGGDHLDEAILQYVRKKYKLLIGQKTAEQIKIEIGYALIDHEEEKMEIRGRDLISGLPETVTLSSLEISEAIKEPLLSMLTTIQGTLENCPAELSGDIVDLGVTLTGGGALLKGMTNWLSDELKVPVHLAESPLECVAIGAGKTLSNIKQIQKVQ